MDREHALLDALFDRLTTDDVTDRTADLVLTGANARMTDLPGPLRSGWRNRHLPAPGLIELTALTDAQTAVRRLLAAPPLPSVEYVEQLLRTLEEAASRAAGEAGAEHVEQLATLLRLAVARHARQGDEDCPVCGTGRLDEAWAAEALRQARQAVAGVLTAVAAAIPAAPGGWALSRAGHHRSYEPAPTAGELRHLCGEVRGTVGALEGRASTVG